MHSDHLQGLEGYNGPLIYCSAATKSIVLMLEKKTVRLQGLREGIEMENRRMYAHLEKVMRVIPYDTPTTIDLDAQKTITVTLTEANHCPGSTMFLIEDDHSSILYTGDLRAEPWWLQKLAQNPFFIPYTIGQKQISTVYLDTSFVSRESSCHYFFPTKAEGARSLIRKIREYPSDTVFHLNAWTFGYEQLIMTIAAAFRTKIHTDPYRYRIFKRLARRGEYEYGMLQCLTEEPLESRFHCCELGYQCDGRRAKSTKVVHVVPTVSNVVPELGAAFLDEHEYIEIGVPATEPIAFPQTSAYIAGSKIKSEPDPANQAILLSANTESTPANLQPKVLRVPYSRHSSYSELCDLVSLFSPLDVYPCVVSDYFYEENLTVERLFGKFCSQNIYHYFDVYELPKLVMARKQKTDMSMFLSKFLRDESIKMEPQLSCSQSISLGIVKAERTTSVSSPTQYSESIDNSFPRTTTSKRSKSFVSSEPEQASFSGSKEKSSQTACTTTALTILRKAAAKKRRLNELAHVDAAEATTHTTNIQTSKATRIPSF
ncbi:beta-lactamase-like protein [Myxozyma melibiosi]|uniref:Protein artemis n=1 Tax=Myxozyma melibiosi TaxID=54550 RepID=A0ABR1EYV7_9ASCO